jgi:cytochrome c-type biogenesis protein CcmH
VRGLVLALLLWPAAAPAVEPDEVLSDPALEARAREISTTLRCPVCRNESIDESHAEVARDIRLLVRERLLAGATDEEVVRAVVDRYGEFILLRPNAEGANLVLWFAAPAMLVAAGGFGWAAVRRRQGAPEALSPEEEARLRAILDE